MDLTMQSLYQKAAPLEMKKSSAEAGDFSGVQDSGGHQFVQDCGSQTFMAARVQVLFINMGNDGMIGGGQENIASFFRDGELSVYSSRYKDIDAVFYDEDYYYLSLTSREFFVIPMDRFTIGDPSAFGDFMYKRCKKVCRWIPARFSNKLKKMRSQRAIVREQMKK